MLKRWRLLNRAGRGEAGHGTAWHGEARRGQTRRGRTRQDKTRVFKQEMDKLIALIKELIAKCFYGELTIKFEHGKIVLIRKTENMKL